jgi:signal transduction histidine kinase
LYSATSSISGDSLSLVGWVELSGHEVLQKIYDSWLKQADFFPELTGEQLKLYYEKLLSGLSLPVVPDWTKGEKQFGNFLSFSVGCLYAWSNIPYNDSELKILRRFASVIDLTFRRYIELQKAETQAKEAIKASSLDRVRGEIASMRTVDDLQRITPIVWHELVALGVPFVRCGVFIINEETAHIQVFLSSPDGKSLAAMDLPFDSSELTINSVDHWRKGLIFKTHWNKQEFLEFMQSMIKVGQVQNQETYQGASAPPETLDLHFVPFKQGMLYVGNTSLLEPDELQLVKSLAESFSIAYARYEDFRQLEEAKNQIEKTFSELKSTQSQLIQAEKMASLGELTAGIAHEIQNPLNFVNNFSEVSTELVDEMKDELAAGSWKLANEIADDLKLNLAKINHHGKRAADIVKGMLQHSRNSSGTKEPTNINNLADEYFRLAYHGLRAKDKTFNATMKTDFDESIGNINIIPQDMGRVILNLITNAFYVVDEKKKQMPLGYEPTVSVSTKKSNGSVEIKVIDNGNGIPQKVLDKIFQPFFTTKPTGQGTGLGLSLAYDIVKAHGGELKVETEESKGSAFIISLNV